MPMTPADNDAPSPFDPPGAGETLVLLAMGEDVKGCYAVGSDLNPRQITPAQFVAAAECEANTQAESIPDDTNQRVMAAFHEFQRDAARRLGSLRRRSDTRNRRYLSRHLNWAIEEVIAENGHAQSIETLRSIFLGDLPSAVEGQLTEIRSMQITGSALLTRLSALRERYRLNPPDQTGTAAPTPQVVRIVCSDGLVE